MFLAMNQNQTFSVSKRENSSTIQLIKYLRQQSQKTSIKSEQKTLQKPYKSKTTSCLSAQKPIVQRVMRKNTLTGSNQNYKTKTRSTFREPMRYSERTNNLDLRLMIGIRELQACLTTDSCSKTLKISLSSTMNLE